MARCWMAVHHIPFPVGECVSQIMELRLHPSAAVCVYSAHLLQIRAFLAVPSEVFCIQEYDFKASLRDLLEFEQV